MVYFLSAQKYNIKLKKSTFLKNFISLIDREFQKYFLLDEKIGPK